MNDIFDTIAAMLKQHIEPKYVISIGTFYDDESHPAIVTIPAIYVHDNNLLNAAIHIINSKIHLRDFSNVPIVVQFDLADPNSLDALILAIDRILT